MNGVKSTAFSTHYPVNVTWVFGNGDVLEGWRGADEPKQRGGYSGDWATICFKWDEAKEAVAKINAEFDANPMRIDEETKTIVMDERDGYSTTSVIASEETVWNGQLFETWAITGPWLEVDADSSEDVLDQPDTFTFTEAQKDGSVTETTYEVEDDDSTDEDDPEYQRIARLEDERLAAKDNWLAYDEDDGDARFDADRDDRA